MDKRRQYIIVAILLAILLPLAGYGGTTLYHEWQEDRKDARYLRWNRLTAEQKALQQQQQILPAQKPPLMPAPVEGPK